MEHFSKYRYGVMLAGILAMNALLFLYTAPRLPHWANVPPAPSVNALRASFLGDSEMAYRSLAVTVQSFGNSTGQVQALKDYNYKNLGTWFDAADSLNPASDYVPFLAGYYFGANQNPKELMPVINYLRRVGTYAQKDKWRYLGQAVYLARHKMNDMPLALQLADEMAAHYKAGGSMPAWTHQMRAIIASDMGEKEMAYNLMLDSLQSKSKGADPAEINYMLDEICNHILTPDKKAADKLCAGQ